MVRHMTVVSGSINCQLDSWLLELLSKNIHNNMFVLTSLLKHCQSNALYVGLLLKLVQMLQLVQNAMASLLSGADDCGQI